MLQKSTSFPQVVVTTVIAALHVLVLVASTDLGSALVYFISYIFMLFVATHQPAYLAAGFGSGSVAAVYDVHFVNVLTGKAWVPEEILTVRLPRPADLAGQPVVVHLADGRAEFMDAAAVTADGSAALGNEAAYLEFPAAEFSPYGIASISGSLDDRLAAGNAADTPSEEDGSGGRDTSVWLWLGCGGAGLLALLIARRRMNDETEQ